MESWFTDFIPESLAYSILLVGIVSFLESLALIGLLLPGIILMTTFGTFIGDGKLSFYPAWISGTIGCFLGDWVSYFIGLYFKDWLSNIKFIKNNQELFNKTKEKMYKHSMLAIIIGRFIGPTRPILPMVAGMLKLPLKKFIFPSIIGCVLWPPVYFFPGIVTGITINIPDNSEDDYFKWFLLAISLTTWLGVYLVSKWWKLRKDNANDSYKFFNKKRVGWMSAIVVIFGVASIIAIQFHPSMFIFREILFKILSGKM